MDMNEVNAKLQKEIDRVIFERDSYISACEYFKLLDEDEELRQGLQELEKQVNTSRQEIQKLTSVIAEKSYIHNIERDDLQYWLANKIKDESRAEHERDQLRDELQRVRAGAEAIRQGSYCRSCKRRYQRPRIG